MQKEMIGGCCVCGDERGWTENPLVYCDGHGCNVAVHQACYGIVSVPTGPWFCRKCESQERAARVKCDLCPQKEGALKRTDTGGWAHVVCALYIPEVSFGDVTTMEPIQVSFVPHDRYNKVCYVCEQKSMGTKATSGACMTCNKNGCRYSFHVTCAQSDGLLCEEAGQYTDNVKYTGYCSTHFQKLKKDKDIKTIPPFKHPTNVVSPEKGQASERDKQRINYGTEKSRQVANEKAKSNDKPRLTVTEKSKQSTAEKTRQDKQKQKGEKRSKLTEHIAGELPKSESEGDDSSSSIANGAIDKGKFTTANFTETVIPTPSVPPSAALLEKTSLTKARKSHSSASSSPKHGNVDVHEKQRETCSAPSSPSSIDVESVQSMSSRSCHSKSDSMDKISEASSVKTNGTPSVTTETVMQTDLPPSLESPKSESGQAPPVVSPTSYENSYKEFMARYTSIPNEKSKVQANLKMGHVKLEETEKKKSKSEKRKDAKVGRPRKKFKDFPEPLKKVRRSSSSSHSSPTKKSGNFSLLHDMHEYAQSSHIQKTANAKYAVKHVDIASLRSGQETEATIRDVFNTAGRSGILVGPQLPSSASTHRVRPQNTVQATSMEQLLERQWQQGSDFLMQQASHLDIASLISCLYQLRQENHRLEERITSLEQRRDHLLAVNARLTVPLHQANNAYPSEENASRTPRVNNIYNHNDANTNPIHLELNSSHSSQGSVQSSLNQSLSNSRSTPQSNRISPAHASSQQAQVHSQSPHIVLATSQPASVIQGRGTPVHSSAGQVHPGNPQITTTQMALMTSPESSSGRASHTSPEGRPRDHALIMRDLPVQEALRHSSAIHQHILYQQQLEQRQQQQQLAYQMMHGISHPGQQAAANCVIQMNGDIPAFAHQQPTPKNSRRNEKRQHGGKDKT
ncbi:protein AF-10-like [Anneissia japonica]|uniref:protein AF-10-like n=1 Tax=Anneissia japonica TaxID=1529436 RepID=UPI001425B012|nr:protein AF-10-like [Anneissia japonica]